LPFELVGLLRQRRLAHEQPFGSAREVEIFGYRHEVAKIP